ncbi:MAG TPA: DUF3037 domain-containing protein [Cytophagaceae bacterium]|jgi:hypothetical protein
MNRIFEFSILKYVHSRVLKEEVNVGILFFFKDQGPIVFRAPEKFGRLKGFYNNFSEPLLKRYLSSFTQTAKRLSARFTSDIGFNYGLKLQAVIKEDFLVDDFSALEFSEIKIGSSKAKTVNEIIETYYSLYFSHYIVQNKKVERHNEKFILKEFRESLLSFDRTIEKYIHKDRLIESKSTYQKFDYAWKNGSLNLVKAISFDLKDPNTINDKAVQFYGSLDLLGDKAVDENYRFDLLISAPQDKGLFDAYEKALSILKESKAPKKIIEENGIKDYSRYAFQEMTKEEI